MDKEKIKALHKHLNLRISLKKTMMLYFHKKVHISQVDLAIDLVELSTADLVRKGYAVL